MIRPATVEDLPALLEVAEMFCRESHLPATFDRQASWNTLWAAVHAESIDFLVAEVEDGIAGGVILTYEKDFTVETFAYVAKLYVRPASRGVGPARALVEAAVSAARGRGAAALYASATAGIDARTEQLFVALFKRSGFGVLGRILWRVI